MHGSHCPVAQNPHTRGFDLLPDVLADVLIKASQDAVTAMNQDDLAAEPGEDAGKF
jgi:hypothetical protein